MNCREEMNFHMKKKIKSKVLQNSKDINRILICDRIVDVVQLVNNSSNLQINHFRLYQIIAAFKSKSCSVKSLQ